MTDHIADQVQAILDDCSDELNPMYEPANLKHEIESAIRNASQRQNELLEQLAAKGFGVTLWKTKAGWLAALMDEHLEMRPSSTCWDHHPSPESAFAELVRMISKMSAGPEKKGALSP